MLVFRIKVFILRGESEKFSKVSSRRNVIEGWTQATTFIGQLFKRLKDIGEMQSMQKYSRISNWPQRIEIHNQLPL